MKKRLGLAVGLLVMGLSASSFAMDHGRDHDRDDHRGYYRTTNWHGDHDRDDHDRKGWSKGKKRGWRNSNLPPGQAKKQHREHEAEWREHRERERERQREAWEHRHRSHPTVVHTQPRPTQAQKQTVWDKMKAEQRAKEQRQAQVSHQR